MNRQKKRKKNMLSRLEQGQGTTLMGKLFLTKTQREILLKWTVFTLIFLLLQVLQDVIFSRIHIFGGCVDVVPALLLLVCLLQEPASGLLFVMICSLVRALSGVVLGPVSLAVLVFMGAALCALRKNHLWGEFRAVVLCCWLGLGFHSAVLFLLGVFLTKTTWSRYLPTLGGLFGSMVAALILYPLVRVVGKIGGASWKA